MGLPGKTPYDAKFLQFCEDMNDLGQKGIPFVFLIDYLCKSPKLWTMEEVPAGVMFDFKGFTNFPRPEKLKNFDTTFRKYPIPFEDYLHSFEIAQRNLKRGESFLINLSAPTPVETYLSFSEILLRSNAPYRFCFQNEFVCFSPETFITIEGDNIATFPMKGTIDASLPNAAEQVLSNPKEAAEHATIVDLLRNDMSRVAQKVWVEKYRYLDTIYTTQGSLLQVSSEIRGILSKNHQRAFGSILAEMLPAGSVTGAPKPRTLEIIDEAENYNRGYYTGVMGYFDGVRFDSAVMIRFIERTPSGLVFKSGGGITALSDVHTEYQELIDKVYLPIPASPFVS